MRAFNSHRRKDHYNYRNEEIAKIREHLVIKEEEIEAHAKKAADLKSRARVLEVRNLPEEERERLLKKEVERRRQLEGSRVDLEQEIKAMRRQVREPRELREEVEALGSEVNALRLSREKAGSSSGELQMSGLVESHFKNKELLISLRKRLEMEEFIREEQGQKQ